MVTRRAKTSLRRHERRCKASKLTIQELRCLLQPYNDDDNVDVVLSDEANHQTLRRWFESLSTNFGRQRGKRLDVVNVTAIKSIERPHLQLNESTLNRFRLWDKNPQTFWSPAADESQLKQRPRNSIETYCKYFTDSAIQLYKKYSTYKILWRFTTAALYLHFRRWKPEIQSIRTTHVRDFLRFMGCDGSDDETTALLAITKAGQRRISFCQLLAIRVPAEPRFIDQTNDEDAASNAANEDERFRSALGILFYESIPDSIFDAEEGLFPRDQDAIIRHLHSIDILSPPTQYDTCYLANKLLDYQHSLVWPNEGDHRAGRIFTRNDITLEQNLTQMTTMEAAGMLESLATHQPSQTYHCAAQKQPTHESAHTQPFAGIMTPVGCQNGVAVLPDSLIGLPPRNAYQTAYQTGISTDPNSPTGLMPPDAYQAAYQAGVSMNPNSYTGFMPLDAYQTAYQAGVSMDPNSYTGFMPPDAYQAAYQVGVSMDPNAYTGFMPPDAYQTAYQTGISTDPNTPTGLMPPDACQTAYQAGVSMDPNSSIGLMPREMHHSSDGYANDSGGNAEPEPPPNGCHTNVHPQHLVRRILPVGGSG
ncbi:hypothetical protein CRV24_000444 [Beauveria bassiana]|nr:hypothetical protein CRV24_000444 [Beauveria bassiana]KAH8721006.1 hypothetical protein HC256_001383 [Beauveria bassiana]